VSGIEKAAKYLSERLKWTGEEEPHPNLNAYAERFVGSIKTECLNRLIFFGEGSLRRAVGDFMKHYHEERNHQGLGNQLIRPAANDSRFRTESVNMRSRLGGLLNYYYRAAA